MKILVVSAAVPFPPIGGGRARTYHLLKALAQQHEVVVVGFTFEGEAYEEPDIPVQLIPVPWKAPTYYGQLTGSDSAVAYAAYDRLQFNVEEPWFASFYESDAMEKTLRNNSDCDVVLFEGTDMGRFIEAVPPVPKVLDLMDVHSLMALRSATTEKTSHEKDRLEADRTLRFERKVASSCDLCLAVSEKEADAARRLLEIDAVEVVPNGVDVSYFTPSDEIPEAGNILFTGTMNYGPNIEAVEYFVHNVFALIKAAQPKATFHIVGLYPPTEVTDLASEDVIVHGGVEDIRPFFRKAEVVAVPLLSGGGTRLKILEAAAAGCAIVSTPLGAEGLDLVAGRDLLLASRPEDFAGEIVRLMEDKSRSDDIRKAARVAALGYDWTTGTSKLLRLVDRLV